MSEPINDAELEKLAFVVNNLSPVGPYEARVMQRAIAELRQLRADNARQAKQLDALRKQFETADAKAADRMNIICELGDKWSDAVDEVREVDTEKEIDAAAMRKTIGRLRAKLAVIDRYTLNAITPTADEFAEMAKESGSPPSFIEEAAAEQPPQTT
jgi:hypothetical protein